jgi:hypothetical protein
MIGSTEKEGQARRERQEREVFEKQEREGRRPLILRGLKWKRRNGSSTLGMNYESGKQLEEGCQKAIREGGLELTKSSRTAY